MSGVQCEFDSQSMSCFIQRLELIEVSCSCSDMEKLHSNFADGLEAGHAVKLTE